MPNIYETEFLRADLNLLVTFAALMEERSVTRAAGRLHLSQAAVSSALGRLRRQFDDPLLERAGAGMRPTARALELMCELSPAIAVMHRAIVGITTFEPDEVDSRFILGMSDDVESFLMPQVISHLHRQHPRVTILVRQANRHVAGGQLESGVIDLALVNAPHGLDGCDAEDLFESTYACLYDGARLALSSPITLEEYVTAPHLLVSYEGVRGAVDDALELQGLSRRIVASTTHFSALMVLLRAVDAVATMPAHAARAFAAAAGLTISPPPLPMPTFTISCAWSRRRSTDPRVIWMRELLRSIVSSMPDLE